MVPTRQEFMFMDGPLPKAVFYGLTFLSIAIMLWQVAQRARIWRQGRPIGWKPDYLGGVLTYVIAQRKVMASRPKTGAPMHLLIFYGFLSLFLATTLLALASYGPLIGLPNWHKGGYYLAYEATFDFLGLFFVFGVGWALVKRWKATQSLGEPTVDPETGKMAHSANPTTTEWHDFAVLLLLLQLGISGYVLEAARISSNPQPWDGASFVGYGLAQIMPTLTPIGYIVLWWLHMVWVWAFFVLLPKMRLRHILTATFAAAGDPSAPMGRLPEVPAAAFSGESPLGAATAADYSRWHLMSLDACMSCGRCTEVCPAYGVGKVLNPKQVVQDIKLAGEQGLAIAPTVSEEALWACTTCNACVDACPVLIRHVDLIVDARRNLVGEGKLTGTATVVLRQVAGTGSAWGQAAPEREQWMAGLNVPLARDGDQFDWLFWVGCAGSTDPAAVRTSKAMVALMNKAGLSFACLGQEEACTGDPARRIGDESTFLAQSETNTDVFRRYGVTKVVTACPHCFNTLKNEYGLEGVEVVHHSQLLATLVEDGRLKPASVLPGSVTFHDPCYLARVNGVSDPARTIFGDSTDYDSDKPLMLQDLGAASAPERVLAEPVHHARKTLCCGAGGGRMWMEEELHQRPAVRRSQELLDTGAEKVALACPFCRIMIDAGMKQTTDKEIDLVDLAEMLQEANQ